MANWTLEQEKVECRKWAFKMECLMSFIEIPFCDAFRTDTFIKSWK